MKLSTKVLTAVAAVLSLGLVSCGKSKIPNTASKIVKEPQAFNAELTSLELTKLMGNGINLANTLEAYGANDLGLGKDPKEYETFWGQPVTTAEQMKLYKAAGFDSIRIPVAWTNAMDWKNRNFTIGTDYLDRVEEVVNYALDAGLYVVFNDHWDGDWWGMFGSHTEQTRQDAWELYKSMWTQLANRFKNYSEKVIFEGGNEEIGSRLNDVMAVPDSGALSEDECFETANKINQTFVDLIRSTGGNNENRFLLIPGYGTEIDRTCDARFVMPTDTAKDKLLISVHYYTPWGYCGGTSVNHWGTQREVAEMNSNMEKMAVHFTEKGYGVIIGEYSVPPKSDGSVKNNTLEWLENFLDNCDYYNFCPMLWDIGEWGHFDRKSGFRSQEMADFYKARSYDSLKSQDEDDWADICINRIEDRLDNAPELLSNNEFVGAKDKSIAWLMYNSQDWNFSYSVGDQYNPDSMTDGLIPQDVEITGPGTYTVGFDFTQTEFKTARSFAFSAIGISNGEILFPGYCIELKSFEVNGKTYTPTSKGYTCSDDGICTRYNIYNEWVKMDWAKNNPDKARCLDGKLDRKRPIIVDKDAAMLQEMETLYITFEFKPAE